MLEIVCTNTVPLPEDSKVDKLPVLSIAPAFAEAIWRIHNGESVSALFDHAPRPLCPSRPLRVELGIRTVI